MDNTAGLQSKDQRHYAGSIGLAQPVNSYSELAHRWAAAKFELDQAQAALEQAKIRAENARTEERETWQVLSAAAGCDQIVNLPADNRTSPVRR